jgi:hypothetical protein
MRVIQMSRIITTVVQVILFLGVLTCLSLMWQDLKADLQEIKNDLFNRK